MHSSKIEKLIVDTFNDKNKGIPLYKRKIFFIVIGVICLIIIIIIIVVATNKDNKFYSNDFKESNAFKNNPDQGFYIPADILITPTEIKINAPKPEQVYHLRCDISDFSKANNGNKDLELTQTALNNLDELLTKIKLENKNAVIRFSYDPKYAGNLNREPSFNMIETHIKQLSPVLNKYYYLLIAIEAGMLGPWGEMHSSDIATEGNKTKVFQLWLQNTNGIPILARTPESIFYYFGKNLSQMEEGKITNQDEGYYLGIFNDCYLSSDTDVGTYRFNRTREVNWLSNINQHLPYGGETCQVHRMNDLDYAIPEMYKLGLSYLNLEYKPEVINKWKNSIYNSSIGKDSLFYGKSGFDYIKSHIGYRLVIRSININYEKEGELEVLIKIDNVGFGNLLKEKIVDLIYTDMNNEIIKRNQIGKYKGENQLKIKSKLLSKEQGEYKVFIKIYGLKENNMDFYFIQFANDNIFNEEINSTYIFKVNKEGKIEK